MTTWTKINKASGTSWTKTSNPSVQNSQTINPGNPIGLLLALTYSTTSTVPIAGIWASVSKASGTAWTKLNKASSTTWNNVTKASGTSWTKITKAT